MIRLIKSILAAAIVCSFFFQPVQTAAESAYTQGMLPLKCFVKFMADWPAADFNNAAAMANKMVASATAEDLRMAETAGNDLMKSYNKDLQPLIDDWEKIIREPLPPLSVEMAQSAEPVIKDKDYKFMRAVGKILAMISAGRAAAGEHEQAVIFLLLNLRFSQIVTAGDHDLPCLMSAMMGGAIANIAIGAELWNLLDSGKLSPAFLKKCVENLARMSKEEPDLKLIHELDFIVLRNVSIFNAFGPEQRKKALIEHAGKLTEQQIITLSEQTQAEIIRLQNEFLKIYAENASHPRKHREKLAEFEEIVNKSAEQTVPPSATIPEITGRMIYLGIAPKARALHESGLKKKYRIIGTGILAATIYGEGSTRSTAQQFIEKVGKRLPKDCFLEEEGKCRIHHKDGRIVAYSVGFDGKDDGGDPEKDIILFAIPRP